MNERTLRVLEFEKIVELLINEAETTVGRELIKKIEPKTEIDEVTLLQEETDEAVHILRLNKVPPFSYIIDVTSYIRQCEVGSSLLPEQCLEIAQVLYCSRNLKNFIMNMEEEFPLLKEIVENFTLLRELEMDIHKKINEHGEVVDDASITLKSIRSSIRTKESRIRERLQQLIRSKSKMLSDGIITFRNNRFVLPVKQEYRAAIGGIVHDQSSSGQTLFMEPNAVVELNNELQQAIIKEKHEIEVILSELSNQIAQFGVEITKNLQTIAILDSIFAKASLAKKMKAVKPTLNENGIIKMKTARHPLIAEEEVVANDITLGESYHAIVITGPNTGGKTVTLKLVGLCVLMAQSGLQIPALDGCELAVFKKVYADIGDEQSIEQNLSTFSSHMTNIVNIVEQVDQSSLVLFDEIGAGTDPQEGAALAMAILDEVMKRKATVIATTHYPELKAYSYNREFVMNASVEFDIETLRPTYRLIIGIPGRSNAFDISKRLGLPTAIIQEAKKYIGIDSENVENMINALEKTKKEAEREIEEAYELMNKSEKLHRDLEKAWKSFQHDRDELYKKAEEKAEKALQKAKLEAEKIVQSVRDMKEKALWKEHEWIEARKSLEDAQPDLIDNKTAEDQSNESVQLSIGDEIKHRKLQQHGEIIDQKNDNEYVIQIGTMKLTAKKQDLLFIKKGSLQQDEPTHQINRVITNSENVKTELDLRGERYEEAMNRLDKYIDDVVVSGYPRATIIHGKGTGALRKGVEQLLQLNPHVKSYRLGTPNEGGNGVTIIELN